MEFIARADELRPSSLLGRILESQARTESMLEGMEREMARLIEVANEVKEAVNARIDREIAKQQAALDAKQAELDALVAAEDAEDVVQNAEIARLEQSVADQTEAIGILESIKVGVTSDLNGDGGLVVPDPVEPEPVTPEPEPAPTEPVEPVEPTEPVEPVEPTEPVEPVAPEVPEETV